MRSEPVTPPLEEHESLWLLTLAPVIWGTHFMLSYVTAAVWCGKYAGSLGSLAPARAAIGWYTAFALVGILIVGWRGLRQHRFGHETLPHDFDSPEDRHRFLGFATLLLSGLSAVATLYVAMAAIFIRTCR